MSKTYLEIVAELEKGATEGLWVEDYGTEAIGGGANGRAFAVGPVHSTRYFLQTPTPDELDAAMVGIRNAQADARLIAFLRNTLPEVRAIVQDARNHQFYCTNEGCVTCKNLDALDAKAEEVSDG